MKAKANRIKNLCEAFASLLERESRSSTEAVSSLIEAIGVLQGDTGDRRLQFLVGQLRGLQTGFDVLADMGKQDFLAKIRHEAEELGAGLADGRIAAVITTLIEIQSPSLNLFCTALLDRLIEATGAERGFVLFYLPESTEADVIAARNFQTMNLSLEEYDFSRTLLREVLKRDAPLLLEDVSNDPLYSIEASVVKFQLKSVLAAPLKQDKRTVGAIYVENNSRPCAFAHEDTKLIEILARFAVFYLSHARLIPAVFEPDNRIFLDASRALNEIVGRDPKILSLLEVVNRIADSLATVLVEGETGTGKELVARALHYQSSRRERPFVAINCAAIPDNLLESELFGHEKGSFTGATGRYIGRIEQGDGGTIFLDEVSDLAYPLQAKLLRFLQSSEFDRLGGSRTIRVDVRVLAATSKDLRSLTESGKFQEALFYRLNVIPLRMPALRERKGDIPFLIDFFLDKFSIVYGKRIRIEGGATELLKEHSFPGNVRELENLIHRLVALAEGDTILPSDLPPEILETRANRVSLERDPIYRSLHTTPEDMAELKRRKKEIRRLLADQERLFAERAVEQANGNLTEAASRLGIHRITLHRMLRR